MDAFAEILTLPVPVSALIVVGGTVAVAVSVWLLMRLALVRHDRGEARELAGSVIFRVSALHGLILALVFAEELVRLHTVERTVAHESALVADVFYDLRRWGGAAGETEDIQRHVAGYVAVVLNEEWQMLTRERRLSDAAWTHWIAAYEGILDLTADTPRQTALKDIMLRAIRAIPELRRDREAAAAARVNPFFMVAAIFGVILTAASFFTFKPGRVNTLLISIFGAYTGIVIYFIIVFANPYLPPGAIEPNGFRTVYQGEVQAMYPPED